MVAREAQDRKSKKNQTRGQCSILGVKLKIIKNDNEMDRVPIQMQQELKIVK